MSRTFVVVLLIAFYAGRGWTICEKTFMWSCDSLDDLQAYSIQHNRTLEWDDLQIAPQGDCESVQPRELSLFNLLHFRYLYRLTVVCAITSIQGDFFPDVDVKKSLRYLSFYDNKIEVLRSGTFYHFNLRRLHLEENGIGTLENDVFFNSTVEALFLSHNRLTSVTRPFKSCMVKRLLLDDNQIINIEPDAFPASLHVLNLDHNELSFIDKALFENLPHLVELVISRNALTRAVDLSSCKELEKVDLSYNKIFSIRDGDFHNLKNLHYLNLEGNKLKKFSFTPYAGGLAKKLIQLAYNLFSFVDLLELKNSTNTKYELTLYGNPWVCNCLSLMEMDLAENRHIHWNECRFETTGNQPLCFNRKLPDLMRELPFEPKNYEYHRKLCKSEAVYYERDVVRFQNRLTNATCSKYIYDDIFFESEKFVL